MTTYFWSIEDTEFLAETDPAVRFKSGDVPDASADIFNMAMNGDVVFRHGGLPVFVQTDDDFTNSGSSVTLTLPATATAGSLLVISMLVDETPGTRAITLPSGGYKSFGGNTVFGSMRVNTYVKVANGTETGSTVSVTGGTTQIIGAIAEYSGFNGYAFRDRAESDQGTSATADLNYVSADMTEQIELLIGTIGYHNAGTITSPTNGYTIRNNVASTGMRLVTLDKVVTDGLTADPDYQATLSVSDNWIARSITLTPQQTMMRIDSEGGDVFLRTNVLPQIDDQPDPPVNNETRIYVREDPLNANKQQLLAMFDDGNIVSLAKQVDAVAP